MGVPRHELAPGPGPIWDQVFSVAPLVIVGSREQDGGYDLAPKHLAMPLGWNDYFAFVCKPAHRTYLNIFRTEVFTVSFPGPEQVVAIGQAAAPRVDDGTKPTTALVATEAATHVDGEVVSDAYLWLECRLERLIDGFGEHSLIVGRIVAASVREDAHRQPDRDDADLIHQAPLLAFLSPARFAAVDDSRSFPYPVDFHR